MKSSRTKPRSKCVSTGPEISAHHKQKQVTMPHLLKEYDETWLLVAELESEIDELVLGYDKRLADSEAAWHAAMEENLRLKQLLVPFLQDDIEDFTEALAVKS